VFGAGSRGLRPLGRPVASGPLLGVHNEEGWCAMSAKSKQVKGHVKEAAGVLSGDKDLESEGKTDRRTGKAQEKVDHAKDKVEEVVDKAKDALHRK